MRKKSTGVSESFKAERKIYQRGNERESSPHYVFFHSEDNQSEDETEVFPLQKRDYTKTLPRQIQVINVQVQSEDTLQALALRYHCSISEIKRINNIHKDNEIYAHSSIKVPVQPYSLLTENIDQKDESNKSSGLESHTNQQTEENTDTNEENKIISLLSDPPISTSSVEINRIILNSTVESLSQCDSESCQFAEDNETDQLISSSECSSVNNRNNFVNTFKCSGADWGLSWYQLLCFSLLLGFAGPIIYVLYIAESPKHNT